MSQNLSIKEAVIGYDGDANVLYYEWQPNLSVDSQIPHPWLNANDTSRGDDAPILAMMRGGQGLWIGKPSEWMEGDAGANGWVAYTPSDIHHLAELSVPGDVFVPLHGYRLTDLLRNKSGIR
jgi:hypothetical protein